MELGAVKLCRGDSHTSSLYTNRIWITKNHMHTDTQREIWEWQESEASKRRSYYIYINICIYKGGCILCNSCPFTFLICNVFLLICNNILDKVFLQTDIISYVIILSDHYWSCILIIWSIKLFNRLIIKNTLG